MAGTLRKIWQGWKKVGLVMGDFVSGVILTVFYFTIFAIFALPYRIFSRAKKNKDSQFVLKEKILIGLKGFKNE